MELEKIDVRGMPNRIHTKLRNYKMCLPNR